jgi:putative heme-binding domain-containing protein
MAIHRALRSEDSASRLNESVAAMTAPKKRPMFPRTLLAILFLVLAAHRTLAVEPWADSTLPTADGLVLWLDASRQSAARKANDLSPLASGDLVGIALDGSGNRLHLLQRSRAAQPRWQSNGIHVAFRFDGERQYLGLHNIRRKLTEFTLFVVASPHDNAGGFRALIAGNEAAKRDYTTGFTIDMNWPASTRFEQLNVEGKGFGGAVNLLDRALAFREFHTIEVHCRPGVKGVQLAVDGVRAGQRDRQAGVMALDELTLGARFYSNEPGPCYVQGFLKGDIAEVLLFDRVLSGEQHGKVRDYLARKHAGLTKALGGKNFTRVVNKPPPVQVFPPGFTVRELPVDLPNINNVRYRPDGKLVALAYNGNVYLLSDSDGDNLEDRADLFWENKGQLRAPIGMALTPPGYKLGQGLFVACKGKLSLLVDTKNAGKADREIVVADGWKELPHGVDALGVAVGRDGKVYFGLGAADFTNAYQLAGGKSRYSLGSERGTILEVSPDFKTRKILATGIRFPVAIQFNRRGDLFCTDQEGATWLPNGNPLDELLHVQSGRHYGFPPRHPRHLPGVIDEPSVYDYGPQHQSTCGLAFNEPVNGGPTFGPKQWLGDAIVTGYSRGKLYRTQLAHTKNGYVARNHLLACLNMLAVDACVSPKGDLVVAVHSGAPDWGSGPSGKGKLYKISYTGQTLAQPVAAWAAGPREIRIAFDRPIDPSHLRDLARKTIVEHGPYVRAGDRFELLRPGYAVVQQQLAAPRQKLDVHSAFLLEDGHTLSLRTAEQRVAGHHAVTLPALGRPEKAGKGELPQHAEVDLDYDLTGVEATWQPAGDGKPWSGWLPHPDLAVSRSLLEGSVPHQSLWNNLRGKGKLTFKTQVDLWQMLRPAVQPGSTLDHTWPAEKVWLMLTASSPFTVRLGSGPVRSSGRYKGEGEHFLGLEHLPKEGELVALEVVLAKEKTHALFQIAFFTNEDVRLRALPLRRFLLPWAQLVPTPVVARQVPELDGGNWMNGRRVFFSDEAGCGKCHAVRGQGGKIGPDLSNLIHRDYASVLQDIREPSAALNPDHIAYDITMLDGRLFFGVPRDAGNGKLVIGEAGGKETLVARAKIESMTPSRLSLMPEGIDKVLSPAKMRDLMTYLLTEPLSPAPVECAGVPPARRLTEVAEAWKSVRLPEKIDRPLRILLACGPKDHGPGEHDYPLWQRRWHNLLSLAEKVSVEMATGWPSPTQIQKSDVIVFYSNNPGWTAARAKELDAFLAGGGGLVYLHYAVDGHRNVEALADRIGLAWRGGQSRFRHGDLELTFPDAKSPISRGLGKLKFVDESYWRLTGDPGKVDLVATGVEEGKPQPLMWTYTRGKGRVFVSILGHYNWTFDDPLFRLLVLRGVCWTAGEPVDRLSELITVGARVEP